jgi:hypothetical protein
MQDRKPTDRRKSLATHGRTGAVCPNVASDKLSADDPRLLLFSKGFCLQSDRSATDARRAGDRKLTRLAPRFTLIRSSAVSISMLHCSTAAALM